MELMHRKAINLSLAFLFLATFTVSGQTPVPKPVVPAKSLTLEDFTHIHKGCPENSECDQEMGKLLASWKASAERWESGIPRAQKEKEMQEQLAKSGWPVEFYTKGQAKSGLNPVLYASACSQHNPKDAPLERIWRGLAFVKGTEKGNLVFSRGDTEFGIKQGELLQFRPVVLHPEGAPSVTYLLPLDESPLYLEKGRLRVLVESEGAYAILGIPADGAWDVEAPPEVDLSPYFEDRSDVACPKSAVPAAPPWFPRTHCQKILDKDSGKHVLAQFFWSC